jgi:hypothetical protein
MTHVPSDPTTGRSRNRAPRLAAQTVALALTLGAPCLTLISAAPADAAELTHFSALVSSPASSSLSLPAVSLPSPLQSRTSTLPSPSTFRSLSALPSASSSAPLSPSSSSSLSSGSVSATSEPSPLTASPQPLDYLPPGLGVVIFLLSAIFARTFGPEWRP